MFILHFQRGKGEVTNYKITCSTVYQNINYSPYADIHARGFNFSF